MHSDCHNEYTGSVCLSALQSLSACDEDENSDVYISNSVTDQKNAEKNIGNLLYGLDTFIKPSDECRAAAVPFFCLYIFGLCGENGTTYQPTVTQCSDIRDDICENEWKKAEEFKEHFELPDCSSLSDDELDCNSEYYNCYYNSANIKNPHFYKYEILCVSVLPIVFIGQELIGGTLKQLIVKEMGYYSLDY